ncbi:glycosyltransferase [Pseudomonas sp. SCB32]|uniref:glycosyltransferase n=1 Tax=Pseudomonas sp. SCB32 TaxID=2653853 RepID=UPI0012648502|nr:glycosyltransferase [Pseudomonas sp. SCB32]
MRFFGVTQFSLFHPGSVAWHISKKSESVYLRELYSDERMLPRIEIFLGRSLPIYQKMAEKYNYRHILLYSEFLPEKWLKVLEDAAEKYPVLYLNKTGSDLNYKKAMLDFLAGAESTTVAWFRVDDDDVLSANYLDRLAGYMRQEYEGMAVSFGMGLTALYSNGIFSNFRKFRQPLLSAGMAFIGRYNAELKSLQFPDGGDHTTVDVRTPVVLDSRCVSYILTRHVSQDAGVNGSDSPITLSNSLSKHPVAKDCARLGDEFPTVVPDFQRHDAIGQVLFDSGFGKVGFISDGLSVKLGLGSGSYSIECSVLGGGSVADECGAIISFVFEGENIDDVIGLSMSPDPAIGWYRYLKTDALETFTKFDFTIPTKCRLREVVVRSSRCNTRVLFNRVKVFSSYGVV